MPSFALRRWGHGQLLRRTRWSPAVPRRCVVAAVACRGPSCPSRGACVSQSESRARVMRDASAPARDRGAVCAATSRCIRSCGAQERTSKHARIRVARVAMRRTRRGPCGARRAPTESSRSRRRQTTAARAASRASAAAALRAARGRARGASGRWRVRWGPRTSGGGYRPRVRRALRRTPSACSRARARAVRDRAGGVEFRASVQSARWQRAATHYLKWTP